MNLQSNALKFTKDGGKIRIICEFIHGKSITANDKKRQMSKLEQLFQDSFEYNKSSADDTSNSDAEKFDRLHQI